MGSCLVLACVTWGLFLHAAHGEPFMVYDPWDAAAFFVLGALLAVLWVGWAGTVARLAARGVLRRAVLASVLLPVAAIYLLRLAIREYEVYLPDFLGF